jgi:hypothetical protein
MKLPIGNYTFFNNFENCPYKAMRMYVARDLPRVETPAMKWGNDVHSAMECRIRDGSRLPDNMQAAEPIANKIDSLKPSEVSIKVEYQLAIDAHGNKCAYWGKDDAQPWFRGKLDLVARQHKAPQAWMLDWKTGKVREEPFELECGALLLTANHPEIKTVLAQYFWMQQGAMGLPYTLINHSQTFGKLQSLRAEAEGYLANGFWPKRRNPLCGFCNVFDCEHNRNKERP